MKLLIDMNLSPTWVRFLIEAGFEAIHWSEIDAGDAPDQDLLRWAADHQYVLLTNDLDRRDLTSDAEPTAKRSSNSQRSSGARSDW
jgi:predicted nuclease of predicted toxin-antitoxin system